MFKLIVAFAICCAPSRMAWTVSLPIPQKSTETEREKPLVLTDAIPLEDAKGRFDHFGSNVVEVINIGRRILDHTITGAAVPQGVAFSPQANKLLVAGARGIVPSLSPQSLPEKT